MVSESLWRALRKSLAGIAKVFRRLCVVPSSIRYCTIQRHTINHIVATSKNSTFRVVLHTFKRTFACFALLASPMLLTLGTADSKTLLFTRLMRLRWRFFLKSFYFFFNCIARYAIEKESRNLSKKIPQITCKAIFRSCLARKYWILIRVLFLSNVFSVPFCCILSAVGVFLNHCTYSYSLCRHRMAKNILHCRIVFR